MADVKWIKIVTDIFDDDKIVLIENMPDADSVIVVWFKLLCMAGKQNNSGVFMLNDKIAYTDEMLATIFRRPLNTVRLALKTFEYFGMVEIVDNVYTIPNWEKHQQLDKLEIEKEQTRKRVALHRAKQKQLARNAYSNVTVTESNADRIEEDKNRLEEDIKESVEKKARFTPPTTEEVKAYIATRKTKINADRFINYYESNGWKVGKNPMKDWKAAVRTWEQPKEEQTQSVVKTYETSELNKLFGNLTYEEI